MTSSVRFRVDLEDLQCALDNHGAFTALIPDWLWDGYEHAKTYTRYRVVGFQRDKVSFSHNGRTTRETIIVAVGEPIYSATATPNQMVLPLEYLLHEESSMDLHEVNVLPFHPDHIAVERAFQVANYPENINDHDIVVTLDLYGRNLHGILSTGKWKRHQIYVMEMNPVHAMYMRLNGMPNVMYTPNGFEKYMLSDQFSSLRSRVRVVYADYYGRIGKDLVKALQMLPHLSSYSVNTCARQEQQASEFGTKGRISSEFKRVSIMTYGSAMYCYMFGRASEQNYYRI